MIVWYEKNNPIQEHLSIYYVRINLMYPMKTNCYISAKWNEVNLFGSYKLFNNTPIHIVQFSFKLPTYLQSWLFITGSWLLNQNAKEGDRMMLINLSKLRTSLDEFLHNQLWRAANFINESLLVPCRYISKYLVLTYIAWSLS